MPPIYDKPTADKYDYLVIGGGSGGSGTSVSIDYLLPGSELMICLQRRAASYGKKVAVVEVTNALGGTCVNVGE
jgi:glutathione reductase (NADPH)